MKRILIIDVGGTNTEYIVSELRDGLGVSNVRNDSFPTPKRPKELVHVLERFIKEFDPSKVILGIPGDVSKEYRDEIYLPPLNFSISREILRNCHDNISILNDVQLLCVMLPVPSQYRIDITKTPNCELSRHGILTLGTSIGFAFTFDRFDQQHFISTEIAHTVKKTFEDKYWTHMEAYQYYLSQPDAKNEKLWLQQIAQLSYDVVVQFSLDSLLIAGGCASKLLDLRLEFIQVLETYWQSSSIGLVKPAVSILSNRKTSNLELVVRSLKLKEINLL